MQEDQRGTSKFREQSEWASQPDSSWKGRIPQVKNQINRQLNQQVTRREIVPAKVDEEDKAGRGLTVVWRWIGNED